MTAVSKVILNGTTLIDVTNATATFDKILLPYTALVADGTLATGAFNQGALLTWDDIIDNSKIYDVTINASSTTIQLRDLKIQTLNAPYLLSAPNYFAGNKYLVSASFPSATNASNFIRLFQGGASALTSVYFPNLETGNLDYTFYECRALPQVVLPKFTGRFSSNTFRYCTTLTKVDSSVSSIGSGDIFNSSGLNTLILRGSAVTTLDGINAFANTPFASNGTGGTLYVHQSLISSYQTASNWSVILSYTNNQILAIENSIYNTKYADGTLIN